MGKVFNLPKAKNDMVTVLEDMLCLAQISPMTGLIVVTRFACHESHIGIAGRYLDNPEALLAEIRKMEKKAIWTRSLRGPM